MNDYGNRVYNIDQDALNVSGRTRWVELDPKWNVQLQAVLQGGHHYVVHGVELVMRSTNYPGVVHFNGALKPWIGEGLLRDNEWFSMWRDEAAWFGWQDPRTVTNVACSGPAEPVTRPLREVAGNVLRRMRKER